MSYLRAGRSIGRTLYEVQADGSEKCVGLVDTPELAARIVAAVNAPDWKVSALERLEVRFDEASRRAIAPTQEADSPQTFWPWTRTQLHALADGMWSPPEEEIDRTLDARAQRAWEAHLPRLSEEQSGFTWGRLSESARAHWRDVARAVLL